MDRKLQRHRADSLRQHGFLVNTPIIRSYLRKITNFYSVISNFNELMPY